MSLYERLKDINIWYKATGGYRSFDEDNLYKYTDYGKVLKIVNDLYQGKYEFGVPKIGKVKKARRRIDTAADIVSLASLLGYSNIRENEFEEYLDECHGLVKKNGLEYGMIIFFKQNDLTEYVELSLRTLSAIYWSRLNFMAYAYNYINFIEEVPDGDRAYGIMSRVIKEVSKGSAIDDAFNNISGIHALNGFNRLPD